ncbi:MAG TPA: GPR endopeptidase [Syntrophomonadaceae bacterium]|nr:GPR endopeptidase [Syntrophomonadaceae bacterium]
MVTIQELIKEFNLNLDLAVEARDLVRGASDREISGVEEQVENLENIKVTTIKIVTEQGAQQMGKPIGTYITIESPPLKINDPYIKDQIVGAMQKGLQLLFGDKLQPNDTVLLVGLGNWRATADSLGPKFIQYSPITRHYHQYAPDALVEGMRSTCGIAPGVLGITGLETFEVIKGIVEKVQPALLVVVDALAAQNVDRIGSSIQMANTGIQPGAGVGNVRHALMQEELGIPVIAIGCPTIVNAAVIASQAVRKFCQNSGASYNDGQSNDAIRDTLSYFGGSLAVTPKEIDDIIENTSRIISMGVATALFPNISQEQLQLYAT